MIVDDGPDLSWPSADAVDREASRTCRLVGTNGAFAAELVEWILHHDRAADATRLSDTADSHYTVSTGTEVAQFAMAQATIGCAVDLPSVTACPEHARVCTGSNPGRQDLFRGAARFGEAAGPGP